MKTQKPNDVKTRNDVKTPATAKGRRNFLLALGAASAGAAAVAAIKQTPEAAAPLTSTTPEQGRGYQVTEHVRTYYRTARV